jgi:hypothetical protein
VHGKAATRAEQRRAAVSTRVCSAEHPGVDDVRRWKRSQASAIGMPIPEGALNNIAGVKTIEGNYFSSSSPKSMCYLF